jgi:NADPH:quinone reductase
MSRAVGITRPGGPEVLQVVEREDRDPASGEVRIRVRYAAVNPTDIGLRENGDQDHERPWVPAASVVAIPRNATLKAAATLPMNGLTALLGLDMLGLSAGDTLAVTGGAGLLASYVIPLAKQQGLQVVADAREDEAELVRGYGADIVIPRSDVFASHIRQQFSEGVAGVYDTALLNGDALPAIRDGGGLAVVRGWDGPSERDIAIHGVRVATVVERTEWLQRLVDAVDDDLIRLRPLTAYPPERAAAAQRRMAAGGLRGRLLIAF